MAEIEKSEQERHFETLRREIAVAVREQGDEPSENVLLRDAVRRARKANMPNDQIEAAVALGSGERDGPRFEATTLEGYGSSGVAVLVKLLTADPRKSAKSVELLFEEHGGNLGDDGCVAWQFERQGIVEVGEADVDDADAFMLEVIEMGGEELQAPVGTDNTYRVTCAAAELGAVADALDDAGYDVVSASVRYEATQHVPLESSDARTFLGFFEKLRGREDVVGAYANWRPA